MSSYRMSEIINQHRELMESVTKRKMAKNNVELDKHAIMRIYHEFDHRMREIMDQHRELMEGMMNCMNCMFKLAHGYKHGKETKE